MLRIVKKETPQVAGGQKPTKNRFNNGEGTTEISYEIKPEGGDWPIHKR